MLVFRGTLMPSFFSENLLQYFHWFSPTGSTCIPRMSPWSSYPDSVGATGLLILCFAKKKCFMILVTCVKLLNDPNSFCSISGGTAGWTRIWISLALRKCPLFFGWGTSWEVLWWKFIISLFCIVTRYSNTLLTQQFFTCLIENVLPKIQLQQWRLTVKWKLAASVWAGCMFENFCY